MSTGKNPIGTPQFPGTQRGANIDEVRKFIKQQLRIKGFLWVIAVGVNTFRVELSGDGQFLVGFKLLSFVAREDWETELPVSFTVTINNEVFIQDCNPAFFTPEYISEEFYRINRPLSGSDTIVVTVIGQAVTNLKAIFYYI
jgi:hypothetical protein